MPAHLSSLPIGNVSQYPEKSTEKAPSTSILGSIVRIIEILFESIGSALSAIFSCASVKEDVPSLKERVTTGPVDSRSDSASTSDGEDFANDADQLEKKIAPGRDYLDKVLPDEFNLAAAILTNQEEVKGIVQHLKLHLLMHREKSFWDQVGRLPQHIQKALKAREKQIITRCSRPMNHNEYLNFFQKLIK